jgi:uroporphyrinogen-III synthase
MKAKYKVLSTKKLEPSLIEKAKENNIEIIEQEFISIKPIWSEAKSVEVSACFQKPYVVFTSANAVAAVDEYLHPHDTFFVPGWKIFCLSGKTKAAVLKSAAVPKTIVGEAQSAAALADKIIEQRAEEIVFFCGNQRRDELPATLKTKGVRVHEVVVYETTGTPCRTEEDFDAVN